MSDMTKRTGKSSNPLDLGGGVDYAWAETEKRYGAATSRAQ